MKIAFQPGEKTMNMKQPTVKPQPAVPSGKAPEKKPQPAPAAPQKKPVK